MKGLIIFSGICFALIVGSLLLPYYTYTEYDIEYAYGVINSLKLVQEGVTVNGFLLPISYVPLFVMALIAPFILIKRSRNLSATGATLAVCLLIYMCVLWMFYESKPQVNGRFHEYKLGAGYYLSTTVVVIYSVVIVLNAAAVRMYPEVDKPVNLNLLDDSI